MKRITARYLGLIRQGPGSPGGWLAQVLLAPLGILYGLVGRLRCWCFRFGPCSAYRAPVPVISVGNLAAGGKGKTPLVDYLGRFLARQGLRVAVVSRGYGGTVRDRVGVVKDSLADSDATTLFGDEPVLLQRRNPQLSVLTARKRADGIRYATGALSAEVVILDDGFQHLAVHRDLDIVMLDAKHPFGNGWPLPAGELREFAGSYRRADLLVMSRCSESDRLPPHFEGPVVRTRHRFEERWPDLFGGHKDMAELKRMKGVAFAGIADPESFFAALRQAGLCLLHEVALPDHVVYQPRLLERLRSLAKAADFLVTTEKDGVKLAPEMFAAPCYQVPLRLDFLAGEDLLQGKILEALTLRSRMNVSDDLLEILACPRCKGPVVLNEEQDGIDCADCGLRYPVRDDIPVMLIDEAVPI